jgi:hypothetical protein
MIPKEITDKCVEKFGENYQLLKVIEEMNELSIEILNYINGETNHKKIIGEAVDVSITIDGLINILGSRHHDVYNCYNNVYDYKYRRLLSRLGVGNSNVEE